MSLAFVFLAHRLLRRTLQGLDKLSALLMSIKCILRVKLVSNARRVTRRCSVRRKKSFIYLQ